MEKIDVETPALIVSRVKMERNIRRIVEVAQGTDLCLRSPMKTYKCPANTKICTIFALRESRWLRAGRTK